jgi:hypothetical protein
MFESLKMSRGIMIFFSLDITAHLNDLNVKLQGKYQLIFQMFAAMKALKMNVKLFRSQVSKGECVTLPLAHSVSLRANTPN